MSTDIPNHPPGVTTSETNRNLQETLAPEFLQTIPAAELPDISMATFAPADTPPADDDATAHAEDSDRVSPPQGFDVLEEIGRGGMGVIYRASQRPLNRVVALKTLKATSAPDDHVHFLSEALISGCLDHPNIVPIYDLEEDDDGSVVLAMKLIDGITWANLLHPGPEYVERAGAYDTEKHLEILLNVCNAVSFAHNREILHRDLKPENVMIGEYGEVFLTDWGIAVSFSENPVGIHRARHRSKANSPAGTPAYMPPEMAEGKGDENGPWTDVYLLGAILFEILTGTAPHKGTTLPELMEAAKASSITFPDDDQIPDSLKAVCLKAMARNPGDRYATVEAFSREIRDYLGHRQSMTLSEHACRNLDQTESQLAASPDRGDLDTDTYYRQFAEVIAAFGQALLLWSENPEAAAGRDHARMEYAQLAYENGDYRLARAQLRGFDDPEAQALLTRIEQAMEVQSRSAALNQKLRRSLLAAGVLVSALLISVGFALYSTRQMGLSISSMVKDLLVENALESLRTNHAAVSAEITHLNVEKAELALQAYAGALESAFASPADVPRQPVYTMNSVDSGIGAPPGLQHLPIYEYKPADGEPRSNPVTFEAQTFCPAPGINQEDADNQIAHIQQVLPTLRALHAPRTAHVIRYFCGFETGLYVAYPGHGNMPATYDNRVRPWYREGRTATGMMQTQPYVDSSSLKVVVSFLLPIQDPEDALLGVAGVDVDVTELFHLSTLPPDWADVARVEIATPRTGEDGSRWLELKGKQRSESADGSELSLSAWGVDTTVMADSRKPAFDRVFRGMQQEATGVVAFDDDGVPSLCAFAPLGIDHSSLLLIVPERAVTADATSVETEIRAQASLHIRQLVAGVSALLLLVISGLFVGIRRQNRSSSH